MPIYRFRVRTSHSRLAVSTFADLPDDLAAVRRGRRDMTGEPGVECVTVDEGGRHVIHIPRHGLSHAVWKAQHAIARSKDCLAASLTVLREHRPCEAPALAPVEDG